MQLKKNEIKIIQLLLASDNYISSYEIANSTGISRRRVRDEMKIVKDILATLHLNLLSKPSQGYYIEGKSSQDLTELQSNFDIGKDLSNEQANINYLAEEIIRITEKIYNIEGKIVCRHRDQNNREVFVDRVSIDEATWDRGKEEIKQILVRNDKSRFALNNRLKVFGVYEPSESLEYKKYLQVLYFFYIMNYFIFPKENIFKSLSLENVDYEKKL